MAGQEIDQILTQIRALSAQLKPPALAAPAPNPSEEAGFGVLLARSVDAVNRLQQNAAASAERFERSEPGADIAAVMIAQQKASIAFQTLVHVRNRFISAYQDIMNMPV
jgi:flagellar hook-basal body complex protein FliE